MTRRLIAAFLIAPLITSAVFAGALFPRTTSFRGVGIIFLLYALVAYVAEAILGFPAFLIYRFFQWRNVLAYAGGGAIISLLAISVVAIVYSPFTKTTAGEFLLCAVAGAAAGLTFRLVAGERFVNRRVAIDDEI